MALQQATRDALALIAACVVVGGCMGVLIAAMRG
jgi:hypothetical protein